MGTDLQHLIDKIQSEGIDKARAEGDGLLQQAKKNAGEIVATAQQEAAKKHAQSEEDAKAFQERATEAIRQAARDVQLKLEKSIQSTLETLLLGGTKTTLALPDVLTPLVRETIQAYLQGGEGAISVRLPKDAEALLPALRDKTRDLATGGKVEFVLDPETRSGFSVQLQNGRVEHDFTAEAITQELSRILRPQLAALLKPAGKPAE